MSIIVHQYPDLRSADQVTIFLSHCHEAIGSPVEACGYFHQVYPGHQIL